MRTKGKSITIFVIFKNHLNLLNLLIVNLLDFLIGVIRNKINGIGLSYGIAWWVPVAIGADMCESETEGGALGLPLHYICY